MPVTRALIIKPRWLDLILEGRKTWEMRSKPVRFREQVGLIEKGSGMVAAVVSITGCNGPLQHSERLVQENRHCIPPSKWGDPEMNKYVWAWDLSKVIKLPRPVRYIHKKGAGQTFVKLDDNSMSEFEALLSRPKE